MASGRSVSYDTTSGRSTITLSVVNSADTPTGPLVLREEIPDSIAADPSQLTFSTPPTRFERGSVIAVWELPDGLGAGQSFVVTYSVAKPVTSFEGFKTAAAALPPAEPAANAPAPAQPKPSAQNAPIVPVIPLTPKAQEGIGLSVIMAGVIGLLLVGVGGWIFLSKKKGRGL
jgi:hypothetical protein